MTCIFAMSTAQADQGGIFAPTLDCCSLSLGAGLTCASSEGTQAALIVVFAFMSGLACRGMCSVN